MVRPLDREFSFFRATSEPFSGGPESPCPPCKNDKRRVWVQLRMERLRLVYFDKCTFLRTLVEAFYTNIITYWIYSACIDKNSVLRHWSQVGDTGKHTLFLYSIRLLFISAFFWLSWKFSRLSFRDGEDFVRGEGHNTLTSNEFNELYM